ncbi:hypothetical protein PHABIO_457 [Pseudomonas phage Phabio]|uniref:Uncharacterized protein n=1 Tax=Pseudomonas phage Phabio TaxID=2006668 RepID=A0A1Y0SX50_9CAUD|nr:hypothetical protein MZD05_gp462 [Pseudomonas phage Phabio]ARV77085.1 hypothetical protein PHABIO_457 [Pseudomonas phage Phabio]
MTREVLEPEILKRFTRYNVYKPTIVLSANAPKPTGDMVVDPKGEYIKAEQLTLVMAAGGLIHVTPEVQEHLVDGNAQKALIRDLGKLGYTDFDQVMKVLTDQRDAVIEPREFEIWVEGWRDNGNDEKAHLIGKATARSFFDAVVELRRTLGDKAKDWKYHKPSGEWSSYGCTFFDNEKDARKFNG